MFRQKTVLVLGAGASWHYNYPTGEELVLEVRNVAKRLVREIQPLLRTREVGGIVKTRFGGFSGFRDQLDQLVRKLEQVQPLVIDYFLGQNPEIAQLAKAIIAYVILSRENQYLKSRRNRNRTTHNGEEDDWVRFVTHGLLDEFDQPEDLLKNQINFITFNYDLSLERRLFESLNAVESLRVRNLANTFLSGDRIVHMYGKVREDYHLGPSEYEDGNLEFIETLGRAFSAADGLRTIAPLEKRDDAVVAAAQKILLNAEYIYFLGYGFDRNNNRLLGLLQPHASHNKQIYFTNFQNKNKVAKAAGADLGTGTISLLGDTYLARQTFPNPGFHTISVEKSIRSVYEALALDFDWPN